ncbi:MAG: cupin domain-containing protein [Solirubrobacteraceae bacterium]
MPNINSPHFDEPRTHSGFLANRARLARQSGCSRLGLSLWELPPSQAAYPYHYHLGDEELIIVLTGTPDLRTPSGDQRLATGAVVSFPAGPQGAHQLVNRTSETLSFLALSTSGAPDIVVYPDSRKVAAAERNHAVDALQLIFRAEDTVDYYDREQPPH